MTLSDAVQIARTQDTLTVYFPPRTMEGLFALLFGAFFIWVALQIPAWRGRKGFYIPAACLFLLAADFLTYHATLTLSAKDQTFSYDERTFYYHSARTYPLASFERSIVMHGSTYNYLLSVLIADNGPKINFGDGYNSRDNNSQAAQAMNAFAVKQTRR